MFQNQIISYIRTGVPALVGWLLAWVTSKGIDLPADTARWATGGLTFLFLLGYYVLARLLERWNPKLGVLLGYPAKPHYTTSTSQVTGPRGDAGQAAIQVLWILFALAILVFILSLAFTKWLLLILVVLALIAIFG